MAFDFSHAGVSSSLKPVGPYTAAGGKVSLPAGINYLEIATANASAYCSRQQNETIINESKCRDNLKDDGAGTGVRHAGVTEDPEGCRGVCEVDENCTVRKPPFLELLFPM